MYANTVTSPWRLIKGKVKGIGVETDFCGKLRKRHVPDSNGRRKTATCSDDKIARIRGISFSFAAAVTISAALFTIDVSFFREKLVPISGFLGKETMFRRV